MLPAVEPDALRPGGPEGRPRKRVRHFPGVAKELQVFLHIDVPVAIPARVALRTRPPAPILIQQ
jgi:hypothetical protein